jgi:RNA polymerase primary sigma factor
MIEEQTELRRSISTYITKFPTPTKEENDKLLKQLLELVKSETESDKKLLIKVREKLVLSNGGFAMKYVMKYKAVLNDDVSIMDLFQEANLGLMEAIDTYNASFNTAFTTHAFFHVRKRIIDFIKKNKTVRAPRDIARNMKHVNEIKNKLYSELQREPLTREIMIALKNRKGIILSEIMIDNIIILLDLNSSGYEENFINEFAEQVYNDEDNDDLFKKMEMSLLKDIEEESDQFKKIVKLRFGIGKDYPHTLEEIKYMLRLQGQEFKN